MARTASQTAKPVNALDALFNASVNAAKSDDTLKAAFVAAGGDQNMPKRILMAGRVAHALAVTRAQALLILDKKGNPKHKPDAGDDVRTIAEEKACGAARVFLSGRLKAWGLKTTETRGGDRIKAAGEEVAMSADKLATPPNAKNVTDDVQLAAFVAANAKRIYDFFLLNEKHEAVTSDLGVALEAATVQYLGAIKQAIADNA